jgi:hypothetical protein
MRAALERAMHAVAAAGARGSALHDALGDATRAMAGTAADRAARPHGAFECVRRVLAIDLPPPPQLADGGDEAERRERAALMGALVDALRPLVLAVERAERTWRDATAREVSLREGREGRREWLRLVVRAWREQADNRRAGAAQWETRWREGRVGVLSRREVGRVEWTVGQYSTLVLEYARLVRGGVIEAARRATSARERAAEAAARFTHGVKRAWASEHGEGREASLDSWVESAGTRTRQRGELKIGEIFARHGPPVAAHSAAEAAKERSAAGRQQVVRYDPGRASVARAAGKRPAAGVQGTGGSAPSKRRVMGSSAGGSSSAADAGDRGMAVEGGEHGPSETAAVTSHVVERGLETLVSDSSVERCESGLSGGEDSAQRGAGTSGDEHGGGHGTTAGSTAAPQVDIAVDGDPVGGDTRAARKRKRLGQSGEVAVRRFAAFAAGVRTEDVVMVGGVHELSRKRAVEEDDERHLRQRDERGERRERRERRGVAPAAEERNQEPERENGSPGILDARDSDDSDGGADEFGGAGGWGAGGLGDRTGGG